MNEKEKYVAEMKDIEVWKEIVSYYTQGNISTIEEAREFVLELLEEEL